MAFLVERVRGDRIGGAAARRDWARRTAPSRRRRSRPPGSRTASRDRRRARRTPGRGRRGRRGPASMPRRIMSEANSAMSQERPARMYCAPLSSAVISGWMPIWPTMVLSRSASSSSSGPAPVARSAPLRNSLMTISGSSSAPITATLASAHAKLGEHFLGDVEHPVEVAVAAGHAAAAENDRAADLLARLRPCGGSRPSPLRARNIRCRCRGSTDRHPSSRRRR